MANRATLHRVLKADEGLRLKPYRCTAGKLTIGVGRNLDDRGITEREAELLLDTDIEDSTRFLHKLFPRFELYGEARKTALISLVFNLGEGGFLKFRNLINAVLREDWSEAAAEAADSKWFQQVKARGPRIVEMIEDDTFPGYYGL